MLRSSSLLLLLLTIPQFSLLHQLQLLCFWWWQHLIFQHQCYRRRS